MSLNDTTNEVPYGYCHCGCGQIAPIAEKTRNDRGWVKGQPINYIHGHNGTRNRTVADTFLRHFAPGAPDQCWMWTGSKLATGYGYVRVDGKIYLAHRVSYERHNPPIPPGMEICHHCDHPGCYNPAHLFLGTHAENMADRDAKGRNVIPGLNGAEHPRAKFTNEQIVAIRESFASGQTATSLAGSYGVVKSTILTIVHGQHWTEVLGPITPVVAERNGSNNTAAKLTEEQVLAIRVRYATGATSSLKLAAAYGVSKHTILRIIHRKGWSHV